MADELSERYRDLLDGYYDCVDRIVLDAYFQLCYSAGGFRLWWRQLMGSEEQLDTAHLMRLVGRFSRRVRGFAKAHGIPVIDCRLTRCRRAPIVRPGLGSAVVNEQPSNLPARRTALIGRERDIAAVRDLVFGTEGRMVTLTGAGGAGKTSLALEVARELAPRAADGAWLVELAPLADPDLVPQAVATVLGVPIGASHSPEQALVTSLRARQLLLVLDNCEHLIDVCARLAETLLGNCSALRLVATSRESLRVTGETIWPVPPLAVPEAGRARSPLELVASPAVRLFVQRAQAVRPDFALNQNTAEGVAEVCRRLDGLPLAIELAAAQVRVLTPEQIIQRLSDSFGLLIGGTRTAPGRQQTLEATLDWSHTLLPPAEQALFRRLAVFAGGFDLPGAEALGGGGEIERNDVLALLTRLVDKSLVQVEERPPAELRYRLLEPVRQYAAQRLQAAGEVEAVHRRHAAYFLSLAETAEPELHGVDQGAWFDRLARDFDNMRAALSWALDCQDAHTALRLVGALREFLWVRSHISEGRGWTERVLALAHAPEVSNSDRVRAKALITAGQLPLFQGDYALASERFEQSVALSRRAGDNCGLALSLAFLGYALIALDPAQARERLEESLRVWRTECQQNTRGRASTLIALGELLRSQENYEAAAEHYNEALGLLDAMGNRYVKVTPLQNLGYVALRLGDPPRASALMAESLVLAREQGSNHVVVIGLGGLAAVAAIARQAERAARLFGAAEALAEEIEYLLEPADRTDQDWALQVARGQMTEATFAAAWSEGRAMPLDEAVAYALEDSRSGLGRTPSRAPGEMFTPREREVVALLARGLTNRQVAEELVITEGTAENYVQRVLGKLGFNNRAQVAGWAAAHGFGEAADPVS
jgi:non-specific serine/threonine protein kinase